MQTNLVFYNVENLFDTFDDPLTNDNAFLPEAKREWHEKRYALKQQRIAKVLKEIEDPMPGIVGLAEIENRKVLLDLVNSLNLDEEQIGILLADSPDERGMDVGLLYRKDIFQLVTKTSIPIFFPSDPSDKTRDILYVHLKPDDLPGLHIYINHWPSRVEGQKATEVKRFDAAKSLRSHMDIILNDTPVANVLVMGDLNCTPDSPPVYRVLDKKGHSENPLLNLGWDIHLSKSGSTNYRGKWLLFDQMLVTPSLLNSSSLKILDFSVVSYSWMLFYNPKYKDYRPNKTYGGTDYHGGFSDPLPVKVELKF